MASPIPVQGEQVTADQLKSSDDITASWTSDNTLTPNGGTSYLYIACWVWSFTFQGNYAFFGSPTHGVSIQYWNGTQWIQSIYREFKNSTGYFRVNQDIVDSGASFIYEPTYIWRIRFTNWSGYYKGDGNGYLYLKGIGTAKHYDLEVKGQFIKSLTNHWTVKKRSGADTDTSKDAAFNVLPASLAIYQTVANRGNPILPTIYPCKFVADKGF